MKTDNVLLEEDSISQGLSAGQEGQVAQGGIWGGVTVAIVPAIGCTLSLCISLWWMGLHHALSYITQSLACMATSLIDIA